MALPRPHRPQRWSTGPGAERYHAEPGQRPPPVVVLCQSHDARGTIEFVAAFFLFGDGGPAVFPSLDTAAGFMEAIDVEHGEYEAVYDDLGTLYDPMADGYNVRLVATGRTDHADLIRRLTMFSEQVGWQVDPGSSDFVLDMAGRISEMHWANRWPKRPAWLSRRMHGDGPPDFRA